MPFSSDHLAPFLDSTVVVTAAFFEVNYDVVYTTDNILICSIAYPNPKALKDNEQCD